MSRSAPGPPPGIGAAAHAQDQGRIYQLGQGSQYITEHTEHHYHQSSAGAGTAAAVVLPVTVEPSVSSGFVGRQEEVARLLDLLDPTGPGSTAVVVSAISGQGGIGKTALAWQAAREAVRRGWFGGGAAFVDLHGYNPHSRIEPGSVFAPMLHALGLSGEAVPTTVAEQAAVYHQVLAARMQQHRPVLLVLDNASAAGQVAPLVPSGRMHRVMVTSRHTLGALEDAYLIEVDVLNAADAVALLEGALARRCAGNRRLSTDRASATQIAELCGHLPLALQVVAALLAEEPNRPVGELLAELGEAGARLDALAYEELTVRAAFDLSYRYLADDQARLFRLLSVVPGPDVSTEVAAIVADQPARQVRRGLAGLARAHLIQRGAVTDRWQMHDLIRCYAAEQAGAHAEQDQQDRASTRVLDHYLANAHAADAHLRALPGEPVPDRFASTGQARTWLEAERANLVAAVAAAAVTSDLNSAARLSLCLGEFLNERRYLDDWLSTAEIALRAARELGNQHVESWALTNLGLALVETGRFEQAIPVLEQAIVICRKLGDRNGESVALTRLGYAVQGIGLFEQAITILTQAVVISREIGARRDEGWALLHLSTALTGMRQFEEGLLVVEQALALFREIHDRNREAQALVYRGNFMHALGRFEEAIPALEQASVICRELGDRRFEGIATGFLSLVMRKVQQFEDAVLTAEHALANFHETGERYGETVALIHLGLVLTDVGRREEASATLKKAGTIYRTTLSNLGLAVRWVQRFETVIVLLEEVVTFFRETGDRHGEATTLGNLAITLAEVKRFAAAREYAERAATLFTEIEADNDAAWAHNLVTKLTQ